MRQRLAIALLCLLALGSPARCSPLGSLGGRGCPAARMAGVRVPTPDGGLGVRMDVQPVSTVRWVSYTVRDGPPLQLVDGGGNVVAVEGDRVGVGGGEDSSGAFDWRECGGLVAPN